MPSVNRIVLASAGSGKTSMIVDEACAVPELRAAMVTYTINNTSEIRKKAFERCGFIPTKVRIGSWYSFLLRHLIRPYQNCLYARRVSRICFIQGRSAVWTKSNDVARHYFDKKGAVYVDKASKFACEVIRETKGKPLLRLEQIFERIYIDEAQDLAGYDLDVVEHLLRSQISVILVADHRQATFSTNMAAKNRQYSGSGIIEKFREWERKKLCTLKYEYHSHRCTQGICDFADQLYPGLPKTKSMNLTTTGHDGVYAIHRSSTAEYISKFQPQTLRYSKAQGGIPGNPINFGSSKGLTFERTLIFPHKMLQNFLISGDLNDAGNAISKIYVAVTRARQSTCFVLPDGSKPARIPLYNC